MPDLERLIADWRRQMLAAGIKTPVPLEELESHLLEDIERRMESGQSAQEAFDAAVQRIGEAGALKAEFKKVRGATGLPPRKWERRVNWVCWGIAGVTVTAAAVFVEARLLFGNRVPTSPVERTLGLLAVVTGILLYAASCPFFRFLPVISHKRKRIAMQLAWGIPTFFFLVRFVAVSVSFAAQAAPADWARVVNGESGLVPALCRLLAGVNATTIPSIIHWSLYFVLSMLALSIYFGIEEAAQRRAATG